MNSRNDKKQFKKGQVIYGGGVEKERMEQHAEEPYLRNYWKNKF